MSPTRRILRNLEIDAAWDEVLDRRVAEVVNGTAALVDGPDSLAQIRTELAARHK
ncbi:addiction module protein [Ruania zhangjianzhongii]|uniref:addiction module protein n=1 Tax=Ruania zhangjianzhongii TaxID=2603206 RepID=UPI00143CF183|nr:addiction module protein [Ruania zhangjianzhongii]